jgi:hypothetical protein
MSARKKENKKGSTKKEDAKNEEAISRPIQVIALAALAVVVVGLVVLRQLTRPPELESTLPQEIQEALSAGLPAVFVFTYSGECCPGTEEFFRWYNETVAGVTGEFDSGVAVIWVDISHMDRAGVEAAVRDLATRYSVASYPSVLVVDASGEKVDLLVGYPDVEGIRKAISVSLEGG